MCQSRNSAVIDGVIERYKKRTKGSQELNRRAMLSLPGGDTRSITFFKPYPTYMSHGKGCRLTDVNGNEYVDFLNNYTTLVVGHAHPNVVEAANSQIVKGTVLGGPSECQFKHAEHLCGRFPGMDTVRYCNSGTEATMFAMRAARAFTGRDGILKMDGGYHGTHDYAEVNALHDFPLGSIDCPGVPKAVLQDVYVTPFNDLQAVEHMLADNADKIAAIIVEPMMGAIGLIPPDDGYLKGLRSLADKYETLLIFDEVITFRLSRGGLQEKENVIPDLTTLGKFIGGGFPVGAFGGKKEIMSHYDPDHPNRLFHSGTFNGNSITMTAGLAAMEAYDQQEADRINTLGNHLKEGFKQVFKRNNIKAVFSGLGSLIQIHWGEGEIHNARDIRKRSNGAKSIQQFLHLELLNNGIFIAPRGFCCISTPMAEKEIDQAIAAMDFSLRNLRSYIEAEAPSLIY